MADIVKNFGKTKLIDTGSITKIVCDGDTLMEINHGSGDINLFAGGVLSATSMWVNPSSGVTEKLYVEGNSRLKGHTYQDGPFRVIEQGANTNPSGGSEVLIYMKGDKLVIAFDHGGTAKYRTLDLTGTDGLWAYSTSAP